MTKKTRTPSPIKRRSVLKGAGALGTAAAVGPWIISPNALASNLGNVGLIEPPFSDQGWRLTNLYWKQSFADSQVVVLVGFLDATDYVDAYALAADVALYALTLVSGDRSTHSWLAWTEGASLRSTTRRVGLASGITACLSTLPMRSDSRVPAGSLGSAIVRAIGNACSSIVSS